MLRGFVIIRLVIGPGPGGAGRAAELAIAHIKTTRRDVVELHTNGIGVVRRESGRRIIGRAVIAGA